LEDGIEKGLVRVDNWSIFSYRWLIGQHGRRIKRGNQGGFFNKTIDFWVGLVFGDGLERSAEKQNGMGGQYRFLSCQ